MGAKLGESFGRMDWVVEGARSGSMGKLKWVSSKPLPEEADDLARCYLKVVELLVDEVDGKLSAG